MNTFGVNTMSCPCLFVFVDVPPLPPYFLPPVSLPPFNSFLFFFPSLIQFPRDLEIARARFEEAKQENNTDQADEAQVDTEMHRVQEELTRLKDERSAREKAKRTIETTQKRLEDAVKAVTKLEVCDVADGPPFSRSLSPTLRLTPRDRSPSQADAKAQENKLKTSILPKIASAITSYSDCQDYVVRMKNGQCCG
jgi:predicted nuclease with TOPRIM domain